MTLVPCKVCGSLTSSNDDICMICGYPREGRKLPLWVKWMAYFLVFAFSIPVILTLFQQIDLDQFRRRQRLEPTEVTVITSKTSS